MKARVSLCHKLRLEFTRALLLLILTTGFKPALLAFQAAYQSSAAGGNAASADTMLKGSLSWAAATAWHWTVVQTNRRKRKPNHSHFNV
ncbi:hypothetical protein BKA62DRAFT_721609 [Auriculariales sp. MPI-PUGE-AT-0066]|nr:hypothetical protein BKA62DRAFT_721609 [Auriculariales sp. MPI-PUGE-AT-0066]